MLFPASVRIVFLSLIVFVGAVNGQQKEFIPYDQKIQGTELSVRMIPVPAGKFVMGMDASKNGSEDEKPAHEVSVAAFWMADKETTWNLYNLFLAREIDKLEADEKKGAEVNADVNAVSGATVPYVDMSFGMGAHGYPAINMTQFAASKFCEWLSAITGNFYRLPTEAEWEYACRAGTQTAYSFGKDEAALKDHAWFAGNSKEAYHKGGLKKPNPWGLYDMHGNVAEWTLDQYNSETYKDRKKTHAKDPWVKPVKVYPIVIRGGAWTDQAGQLRSSARFYSSKNWKTKDPQIPKSKWWFTDAPFVGFRIVRPYHTPTPENQALYWKEKH
jgi:formylglycine-generating enzyme required for sulfatase activity